jgi:hypothetical protein
MMWYDAKDLQGHADSIFKVKFLRNIYILSHYAGSDDMNDVRFSSAGNILPDDQEIPRLYEMQRFITVFTKARYWSLF